jgi:hypothetical protein
MEYNWTPTTLISNSGCFFVENSALNSGIVNSNDGCVFKDSSYNGGIINATGVSYLNNSTSNGTNLCAASFYDNSSYTGGYSLGSSFYDTSSHVGGYTPTGYFYNSGIISGGTLDTAEVIYPHQLPFTTGTASIGNLFFTNFPTRTVYFYSVGSTDFPDLNNWWDDNNHTVQASYLPGGSPSNRSSLQNNVADSIVILSNLQNNMAGCFTSLDTVTVSGNASLDLNIGSNALYFFDFSNHGAVSQTTNETYFFDHSTNTGTINTNYLYVNYPVSIPLGGTINVTWTATYYGYTTYFNDTITSDGDWNNANNWFLDEANTIASNAVPTETFPGSSVILQTNVSYSSGGTPTAFDLLCPNQTGCPLDNPNPGISLGIPVTVYGLATFNTTTFCINSSTGGILTGTVNGDALFKDFGTNQGGTVTGTATFSLQAAANMIQNGYDGVYTIIEFDYQKGINGSSILGLV